MILKLPSQGASGEPVDKKAKVEVTGKTRAVCVPSCQPGPKSGCPNRGKGKPAGHVACGEVDRMLVKLGVDPDNASGCVKAAIMKGHIRITGKAKDLEVVVVSKEGLVCGHIIKATLGDLLKQPDCGRQDYEEQKYATAICQEKGCKMRTYVMGICEGKPRLDEGKFFNHCRECPGFGQCTYAPCHCGSMRVGERFARGSDDGSDGSDDEDF